MGRRPSGASDWRLRYDFELRHFFTEIIYLREECRVTWDDISLRMEKIWCERKGIKFRYLERYWDRNRCIRGFDREKLFLKLGNPDPNKIDYKKETVVE